MTVILWVGLGIGCRQDRDSPPTVRLGGGPVVIEPAATAPTSATPLRFALASILSPSRGTAAHEPFARYLASRLGQPVELIQRRTYAEVNELLGRGVARAGLICTGAYAIARERYGVRAIAVPVVDGRTDYHALLIARAASTYRSVRALRGAVFAFSDPSSNTGYLYVAELLHAMHTSPDRFFSRTMFTYSHDNTVEAVRDGIVDAGAIHSLVWNAMVRSQPELAQAVVVIDRSPPYPIMPVVVSPDAPPEFVRRLTEILLTMAQEPAGRLALAALGAEAFVPAQEALYDAVVESWRRLGTLQTPPPTTPAK